MNETLLVVPELDEGMRLDKWLAARHPDYSRAYFQRLIEKECVLVNGEGVKKRLIVEAGDEIEVEFELKSQPTLEPENIPLDILYEDEFLLAVNKPSGMVVHPGAGNFAHTFANALIYHCNTLEVKDLRPGIVHRLDKDTSGVLLGAKQESVHGKLVSLFASREIKKEYLAICLGHPGNQTIETFIGRHPTRRKEMAVVESGGKWASTYVETLSSHEEFSFVRLHPHTGRTHQLRVHLKKLNTPIIGDPIYGAQAINKKYHIERTLLHASRLIFVHPISNQILNLTAPLPDDFVQAMKKMNL